jgi:CheY-like chemotaxis protein
MAPVYLLSWPVNFIKEACLVYLLLSNILKISAYRLLIRRVSFLNAFGKDSQDIMAPVHQMSTSLQAPIPQRRVLVADDDPSIRAFLHDFLELCGFEVRIAADGSTALALFRAERFDVVLVDFQMPGLTGLEIATEIRQENTTIPIGLITGVAHALDPQYVSQAGVTRVFRKPFNLEELAAWLGSLPY